MKHDAETVTEAFPLLSSVPSLTTSDDQGYRTSDYTILGELSFSFSLPGLTRNEDTIKSDVGPIKDTASSRLLERLSFSSVRLAPQPFSILMEVIGGRNLHFNQYEKLLPYCVINYGTKTLHRTLPYNGPTGEETTSTAKRLGQALTKGIISPRTASGPTVSQLQNPIWTLQHDSLWTVTVHPSDISDHHKKVAIAVWGRQIGVKQKRGVLDPILLGKVNLTIQRLLELCTEERMELPLLDELGRAISKPSSTKTLMNESIPDTSLVAFRCRIASPADLELVRGWNAGSCDAGKSRTIPKDLWRRAEVVEDSNNVQQSTLITELPEHQFQGASLATAYASGAIKAKKGGQVLVKPYPDPERMGSSHKSTKSNMHMHRDQFHEEINKPSGKWLQAGISKATNARIYLEILSCHNLPNVDYGEKMGNKTDAFCAAILGDSLVETDVIDDELSPHWPPWTQRAFVFNLAENSMPHMLYLGVFGFKRKPIRRHKPIGRVEINWVNLPRNSLLELEYNLYKDSHSTIRQTQGKIRLRLRIDVPNERATLLTTLTLPKPTTYINVRTKKSWAVAKYTACGEYDNGEKFQLGVLHGYIDEIVQGYLLRLAYNFADGARSLIFWQPHNQFQVRIGKNAVFVFPLYSLLCFIMGMLVVEHPQYLPGMFFLGLGLFLLAQLNQRNRSPSPWRRCPSFWHYVQILFIGKALHPKAIHVGTETIGANEGWEETEAQEKAMKERINRDEKFFQKKDAVEKEIEELENVILDTKSKSLIQLELLVILGKIQAIVGDVCRLLRLVDTVITWEESDLAFSLTLALLLIGSFILFLPWAFILRWIGRIVVVVVLGPQNRLLDVLYIQKHPDDERKLRSLFQERMFQARCHQEEIVKLKAFRQTVFGRYSIAVPNILWTPHKDYPLHTSTAHFEGPEMNAVPSRSESLPTVFGQMLFGNMIPRPQAAIKGNHTFSMQQKELITTNCRRMPFAPTTGVDSQAPSKHKQARQSTYDLDAGFEVTDLFDEEAQYVLDVLKPRPPPQRESIHELGMEVTKSQRFLPAWKSDNEFSTGNDDGNGSSASDVLKPHPPTQRESIYELGMEVTESQRFLPAWKSDHKFSTVNDDGNGSTASSDAGSDTTARKQTSVSQQDRLSQLDKERMERRQSTVELGLEVAEEFESEVSFAQRSWRGASFNGRFSQPGVSQQLSRSSIKSLSGLVITEEYEDEAAFARLSWQYSSRELPPHPRHLARIEASVSLDDWSQGDPTTEFIDKNSPPSDPVSREKTDMKHSTTASGSCGQSPAGEQQPGEAAAFMSSMDDTDDSGVVASVKDPNLCRKSVRFSPSVSLGTSLESPSLSIEQTFSIDELMDDDACQGHGLCGHDVGFEVVPDWLLDNLD